MAEEEPQDWSDVATEEPQSSSGKKWIWILLIVVLGIPAFLIGSGCLATLIAPAVIQEMGFAQRSKAEVDLVSLQSAVSEYAILNGGVYPESLELLVTPDENGNTFLKARRLPLDPWKNPYHYEPPTKTKPMVLICYGADGKPGGEGENEDIVVAD